MLLTSGEKADIANELADLGAERLTAAGYPVRQLAVADGLIRIGEGDLIAGIFR